MRQRKKPIQQLGNPVEAVYAYAGCMFVADTFGFTKGPEECGKQISIEEYVALMVQYICQLKMFSLLLMFSTLH